ncbi:MAG: bifunctional phosphoglucose/phosphomannose isomerase [Saprospiraceae bacterium]|nr:bifunctional phosphoglucose/phosphomannose isomerase [Saprospiraceae bacterium]
MMEDMIREFPQQVEEALSLTNTVEILPHQHPTRNVLICGMGGSGIGGAFVRSFFRFDGHVPIVCNNSYDIPNWVDEHTVVIASSYSGNTEETVEACQAAQLKNAHVIILTSGGKLGAMAEKENLSLVRIPSGSTSPRTRLGYSIVLLTKILVELNIVNEAIFETFRAGMQLIKYDQDSIMDQARSIARALFNKTTVIYSPDHLEPCAIRLRQQINENSKALCWHHVVPEMNHNELVGWKEPRKDTSIILFRSRGEHKRVAHRMDFLKNNIEGFTSDLIEIYAKGNSIIERSLYLIHLSDWVSLFLARRRGVDPVEIRILDQLKRELGNL